ncbi:hypothetical protein ACU4GD_24720 [Cupriavidus basilensis]
MVMSLSRRRMLLEYARQRGAWIVEDDYDSEFRFEGRRAGLAARAGRTRPRRSTWARSPRRWFPGLRMGFMVLPKLRSRRTSPQGFQVVPRGTTGTAGGARRLYRGRALRHAYPAHAAALRATPGACCASPSRRAWARPGRRPRTRPACTHGDPPAAGRRRSRHQHGGAYPGPVHAAAVALLLDPAQATQQGLLLGYACVPEAEIAHCIQQAARR